LKTIKHRCIDARHPIEELTTRAAEGDFYLNFNFNFNFNVTNP